MNVTPEKEVVKECLEYLKILGIYAYRTNTGAAEYQDRAGKKRFVRYGKPGVSDITGVMPGGRFIAVECKAANGRLSNHQTAYLRDIERMGGLAIVARSAGDITTAIKQDREMRKRSGCGETVFCQPHEPEEEGSTPSPARRNR